MSKPTTPAPESAAPGSPKAATTRDTSSGAKREMRHAADTLRLLTDHCPDIVRAWVSPASPGAPGRHSVLVHRKVRDVEGNTSRTFVTSHTFQAGAGWVGRSMFPLEIAGALRIAPSPSGKYLAVLRSRAGKAGGKDKYFLDVFDSGVIRATVELTTHHGKVLGDGWFGCLEWSSDETLLLYVTTLWCVRVGGAGWRDARGCWHTAHNHCTSDAPSVGSPPLVEFRYAAAPKEKKTSSFWAKDKASKNHGTEYEYKEDW